MSEQTQKPQSSVSTVSEPELSATDKEMWSLLTYGGRDAGLGKPVEYERNRNPSGTNPEIRYNSESHRIEVKFPSKPETWVRDTLKSLNFGWNKWERAWELYNWQARLYDRSDLARFLTTLSVGMVGELPEIPEGSRRQWWKEVKDRQDKAIEQLAEATQAERDRGDYGLLLKYIHGFRKYSFNNTFTILMECPHATFVCGEKQWNSLNRFVKWGESPIVILGPRFKRFKEIDSITGEEVIQKRLNGFLALPVYDISQTYGEPLPEMPKLSFEGDQAKPFFDALKTFCDVHGLSLGFGKLPYFGVSSAGDGKIKIDDRHSINDQAATLIHELAHEYHNHKYSDKDEKTREIEAEGTAYVICDFFGLPTIAPTYLALHANATSKDIVKHGATIHESTHVIISYLLEYLGYDNNNCGEDNNYSGA
jgi:hypothetical protein